MDIDHFKLVNDKYGHEVGDKVLKEFASRIAANVRGIDLACRYGGEEFVIAMPDTDIVPASAIAERLRRDIETTPLELGQAPHQLNITISVGVAKAEGANDSGEALLHRADQALYRAKHSGRNRVVADAA
jgi:two-component system, cell cycle response regulator